MKMLIKICKRQASFVFLALVFAAIVVFCGLFFQNTVQKQTKVLFEEGYSNFENKNNLSSSDAFIVTTPQMLKAILESPASISQKEIALGGDLDMAQISVKNRSLFSPKFDVDGRGFSIKNLTLNSPLFETLTTERVVKNIKFDNLIYIASTPTSGAIAVINSGTIKNVVIKSATVAATDQHFVGGIVGINRGNISGCAFDGKISGAAGFGGVAVGNESLIQNTLTSGDFSAISSLGGIAIENSAVIINSLSSADLSAVKVGGICVTNTAKAIVRACSNFGKIKASIRAGGVVCANNGIVDYSFFGGTFLGDSENFSIADKGYFCSIGVDYGYAQNDPDCGVLIKWQETSAQAAIEILGENFGKNESLDKMYFPLQKVFTTDQSQNFEYFGQDIDAIVYEKSFYIDKDITHSITVQIDDNQSIIMVSDGDFLQIENAQKKGHTFEGWYCGESRFLPDETQITADILIEARFSPQIFSVVFLEDQKEIKRLSLAYGTTINMPVVDDKKHYIFEGWKNENKVVEGQFVVSENHSFDATFSPRIYKVIVETNLNDKDSIYELEYNTSQEFYLQKIENYTLQKISGSDGFVLDMMSFRIENIDSDRRVFAHYKSTILAVVNFESGQGFEVKIVGAEHFINETFSFEIHIKTGYDDKAICVVEGENTLQSVEGVYSLTLANESTLISISGIRPKMYTITIVDALNAKSGDISGTFGVQPYLAMPYQTLGYKVQAFYLDEYFNAECILTNMQFTDIFVYVKWQKEVYQIALDARGGQIQTLQTEARIGDEIVYEIPSHQNKVFKGWHTSEGVQISQPDGVAISAFSPQEDAFFLVAKWLDFEVIKDRVVYNAAPQKIELNQFTDYYIVQNYFFDGQEIDFPIISQVYDVVIKIKYSNTIVAEFYRKFTIQKRPLKIVVPDTECVFGDPLIFSPKYDGLAAQDTAANLLGSLVVANKTYTVGEHLVQFSGVYSENYIITFVPFNLKILPRVLSDNEGNSVGGGFLKGSLEIGRLEKSSDLFKELKAAVPSLDGKICEAVLIASSDIDWRANSILTVSLRAPNGSNGQNLRVFAYTTTGEKREISAVVYKDGFLHFSITQPSAIVLVDTSSAISPLSVFLPISAIFIVLAVIVVIVLRKQKIKKLLGKTQS